MDMNKQRISLLIITLSVFYVSAIAQKFPFEQTRLPYSYNALEPVIDAMTMEIHYSKHHAAYVKNLNSALRGTDFESWTMDELMLYASETTDAIRNNGGGHYNHDLFWQILGKGHPFNPQSEVGKAVINAFGSVDTLRKKLNLAGMQRFGSGWAWMYVTPEKKLAVCSTPNQDNPIMDVAECRGIPVLGIDVWEHAYYLKYQNKRADYLGAILDIINWDQVNTLYKKALEGDLLRTIEKETWTALNEFHVVMAQTFHPSEEGNLAPIRQRSGEMVEKAQALLNQPIPASFNTVEIKKSITDLLMGAKELDEMVRSHADDKMITTKLNNLHDTFHTIQGQCRH
jgi:superoxide dismutase